VEHIKSKHVKEHTFYSRHSVQSKCSFPIPNQVFPSQPQVIATDPPDRSVLS